MELAAASLPRVMEREPRAEPLELHLLTGRRFWYQAAFCLWTFARQSGRKLRAVIYDDGTLDAGQCDALARVVSELKLNSRQSIQERLDLHLPRSRFPSLRSRADDFVLLHKLMDPHVGLTGWKLLIDCDLLFFHRPLLLLDWLENPICPLHALDFQNAYGYPLSVLSRLAGAPVPECVNTGLLGLCSEQIDWERMEYWCRLLMAEHGARYYQEQAFVAMLLAHSPRRAAPASDYVTLPRVPEALECKAVMHHYVAESKRWYYQFNWKRVTEDVVTGRACTS